MIQHNYYYLVLMEEDGLLSSHYDHVGNFIVLFLTSHLTHTREDVVARGSKGIEKNI